MQLEEQSDRPDPAIITKLATGYWSSMVLIAANRLGVFSQLSDAALSASDLAARCSSNPRGMEMLLNACVAERLLVKDDGLYRNSATAQLFLVRGSKAFLGDALKYTEDLYPVWGKLEDAVRTSRPPLPAEDYLGTDREKTRNFVYGMHNRALGIASAVVAGLNLEGRRQLLDVGGGPGTYSILLAQKTPGLRCTVLDLAPVVDIAGEIIASYGCADRVGVMAGDYSKTDFPSGNDAVLMSGMMHRELEDTCRTLLSKAFRSLEKGGIVIVSDVMFDDDSKTSPRLSALFALNMMLTSEAGSTHAQTTFIRWMGDAGVVDLKVERLAPPMSHIASIIGRRPA
ncbi:MAG: methyltransferase domain-containing protein [Acidobacteria bacterium]|nr:methyltransferase domain-containing protein [Acidobacteriota bacterium]